MLYANARMNGDYALNVAANQRGKPEAFTDEENDAMRASMREMYTRLLAENRISNQTQFGKLLNVGQQTAGKILGAKRYGLSRPTALAYAILCGYDSPETLLEELGKKASPDDAPKGWLVRDYTVKSARSLGYDETVLGLVVARYADWQYRSRPRRWWMDRIVQLQQEIDAEKAMTKGPDSTRRVAAAPLVEEAPLIKAEPAKKTRRRA